MTAAGVLRARSELAMAIAGADVPAGQVPVPGTGTTARIAGVVSAEADWAGGYFRSVLRRTSEGVSALRDSLAR
jgi:hypothetical protein